MPILTRRTFTASSIAAAGFLTSGFSPAAKKITLGLLATGTANWEIAAMRELGLDKSNNIEIEVRGGADTKSGKVALQGGAVDVILSDYIWVSIQRHLGADLTFVPHSLSVGGVMVSPDGPVNSLEDLAGKTIGVAGGPVDKSWVILQAYYKAQTGNDLGEMVDLKFGPPPLINKLLASGEVQASLNFWHWNARAKAAGNSELISVKDMLTELGVARTPPLLGWVFSERYERENAQSIKRFLDASFATKSALLTNDAVWDAIRSKMRDPDDALFAAYKAGYRAGIVTSYGEDDLAAAAQSYSIMAEVGGSRLVGDNPELAAGTFWPGYDI